MLDTCRPPILPSVPIFSITAPCSSSALDVLAAAAAATDQPNPGDGGNQPHVTSSRGIKPSDPVADLPNKLVKHILNLDFVDMSEVSVEDDSLHSTGRPHPARLPITSISQWLERFSMMAAIIVTRFPLKAPELLAYQSLIVRAQCNYEGEHWVAYDRQFRREALARRDLNWSVPDSRLYQEEFTGRALFLTRCSYCLAEDHSSTQCSRNPNRPTFPPWLPDLWQF